MLPRARAPPFPFLGAVWWFGFFGIFFSYWKKATTHHLLNKLVLSLSLSPALFSFFYSGVAPFWKRKGGKIKRASLRCYLCEKHFFLQWRRPVFCSADARCFLVETPSHSCVFFRKKSEQLRSWLLRSTHRHKTAPIGSLAKIIENIKIQNKKKTAKTLKLNRYVLNFLYF